LEKIFPDSEFALQNYSDLHFNFRLLAFSNNANECCNGVKQFLNTATSAVFYCHVSKCLHKLDLCAEAVM